MSSQPNDNDNDNNNPPTFRFGTSCQKCCQNITSNNIQTGCSFDILSRLKENIITTTSDDDSTYFFLQNKICPYFRDKTKIKDQPIYNDILSKIAIKYEVLIYCDGNANIVDLKQTLRSIQQQILPPHRVMFLLHQSPIQPIEIRSIVTMPFSIESAIDPDLTKKQFVDLCVNKMHQKSSYYTVLPCGYVIGNAGTFRKLNQKVNIDMQSIVVGQHLVYHHSTYSSYYNYIIYKAFHKIVRGNTDKTVIDKFQEISKNDKSCPIVML